MSEQLQRQMDGSFDLISRRILHRRASSKSRRKYFTDEADQ